MGSRLHGARTCTGSDEQDDGPSAIFLGEASSRIRGILHLGACGASYAAGTGEPIGRLGLGDNPPGGCQGRSTYQATT